MLPVGWSAPGATAGTGRSLPAGRGIAAFPHLRSSQEPAVEPRRADKRQKERHLPFLAGAGLRRVLSEGRPAVLHSGTSVRRSPLRIRQGLFQRPARSRRANARSVRNNHPARRGPKGRKPTTPDENIALKIQVQLPQFDLSIEKSGYFSLSVLVHPRFDVTGIFVASTTLANPVNRLAFGPLFIGLKAVTTSPGGAMVPMFVRS